MQNQPKSYTYDNGEKEIERLTHQAKIAEQRELSVLKSLGISEKSNVLDAGCGPGLITQLIASLTTQGKVVAYDINKDFVKTAKEKCAAFAHVKVVEGSLEKIEEPNESFDVVYSRFVFSHLSSPLKVLSEIHRVLRPGGVVCLVDVDDDSTVCHPPRPALTDLLEKTAQVQSAAGGNRYIGRELPILLSKAGFQNVDLRAESFYAVNETTFGVAKVLIESRASYLGSEEKKALENEVLALRNALSNRTAVFGYQVFIGSGVKASK